MEGYQLGACLAEGRFGQVFSAVQTASMAPVAIKKIRARRPMVELGYDPWSRSGEREIEVLSHVKHPHVIRLLDHYVSSTSGTTLLVFEFMSWNLATVLEAQAPLRDGVVRCVMSELMSGVAHLHSVSVMHRDLKPANLLLHEGSGSLKIADFGSARFLDTTAAAKRQDDMELVRATGSMTQEVCTRWYKAPEMLFGSISYTHTVDQWATGCLFAELLSPTGEHPFPGGTDIEQLSFIFETLGTPVLEDWPEAEMLPDFGKIEFLPCQPKPFALENDCSPECLALLRRLLQLNPARRISADDALSTEYFRSACDPQEVRLLMASMTTQDGGDLRDQVLPGQCPSTTIDILGGVRGRVGREGSGRVVPLSELSSGANSASSFFAHGAEFERLDFENGEFERVEFEGERLDLETGSFEHLNPATGEIETTVCSLWNEEDVAQLSGEASLSR